MRVGPVPDAFFGKREGGLFRCRFGGVMKDGGLCSWKATKELGLIITRYIFRLLLLLQFLLDSWYQIKAPKALRQRAHFNPFQPPNRRMQL